MERPGDTAVQGIEGSAYDGLACARDPDAVLGIGRNY
jgi:hypothetical protein